MSSPKDALATTQPQVHDKCDDLASSVEARDQNDVVEGNVSVDEDGAATSSRPSHAVHQHDESLSNENGSTIEEKGKASEELVDDTAEILGSWDTATFAKESTLDHTEIEPSSQAPDRTGDISGSRDEELDVAVDEEIALPKAVERTSADNTEAEEDEESAAIAAAQSAGSLTPPTLRIQPAAGLQMRVSSEHMDLSPVREEDCTSSGRVSPELPNELTHLSSSVTTARSSFSGSELYRLSNEQLRPVTEAVEGIEADPMPMSELPIDRDAAATDSPDEAATDTNGAHSRTTTARTPYYAAHRRTPTNSSLHSLTLPANRNRVRYSWQSAQDDEPNKPRIYTIKMFSTVATASAGFPQGEAFGFSISAKGKRIAAYNSTQLYVLHTAALPVGITQDYALRRRPLAVELTDDAGMLAILADEHTVNIYESGPQRLQRVRTITLDFPCSCIALSPTGGLLAAAYEGGVEIFSLATNALPTDRRAVRSVKMDRLTFSADSSTLLGTTTRINAASTVIVSVPIFPASSDNIPTHEELKVAWCTDLLHPENIRNSSHATFMRENSANSNDRLFAWNGAADTFGILDVSNLEYGSLDFPIIISPPLSTCGGLGMAMHSCPAVDEPGDTVAMIVNERTVRLYIVPDKASLDGSPMEAHSIDHELDEGYGCPFSEVRWLHNGGKASTAPRNPLNPASALRGRLIATSPGGVASNTNMEESVEDIEGGRIIIFDFDPQFTGQPCQSFDVYLGKSPPQLLDEEQVNVAQQVALVRSRTVKQSKGGAMSQKSTQLGRSATTFNRSRAPEFAVPDLPHFPLNSSSYASMQSLGTVQTEAARSLPDLLDSHDQVSVAFEEPYAQNAPRSQMSLKRAATNAQRHRYQALEEQSQEGANVESSNNFLALPEYSEEPNAPLPNRYRAMAGLDQPAVFKPKTPVLSTDLARTPFAGPSTSGSMTAPAHIAENFNSDEAFRRAHSALSFRPGAEALFSREVPTTTANGSTSRSRVPYDHYAEDSMNEQRLNDTEYGADPRLFPAASNTTRPISPVSRIGTFESTSSMPRSLKRAYSNGMAIAAQGPPPSIIGDWRNVAPLSGHVQTAGIALTTDYYGSSRSISNLSDHRSGAEQNTWSPGCGPTLADAVARYSRPGQSQFRHSTSLLNSAGYGSATYRSASSASTHRPSVSGSDHGSAANGVLPSITNQMPPHIPVYRTLPGSPSLFPTNQSLDHVPLRESTTPAGTVAHPITNWRPPTSASGPSTPAAGASAFPAVPASSAGLGRSFSRRSSVGKGARNKKSGLFGRGKRRKPLESHPQDRTNAVERIGRSTEAMHQRDAGAMNPSRNTKSESKCSIM